MSNSNLKETTSQKHLPLKIKSDIEGSLGDYLKSLNIILHSGHLNDTFDFITRDNKTISVKTNMYSNKVCPQYIGQTTLANFNKKTGLDLQFKDEYKKLVFTDTRAIIIMYLKYLFCCDTILSFGFSRSQAHSLTKTDTLQRRASSPQREAKRCDRVTAISLTEDIKFVYSKNLNTWNESMTTSILIDDTTTLSLCEFQIHNNRNCIKCRFNFETIIILIEKKLLVGITIQKI